MAATPSKELTNKQVRSVRFGFYTDEEVRRMSAKKIVQPVIFDNLKNAVPGGLYDSAMGPVDTRGRCGTCSLPYSMCPGHFGHIELPVPVYNPLIFNNMYKILRQQCHFCYKFRMDREEVARFERKLSLLVSGRLTDAAALQVARGAMPKELESVMEGGETLPDASGLFTEDTCSSSGLQRLAPTLTSHTLEAIQDTISDFFARVPKGRCRNCEAHSPNIKRQGYMKLFKVPASARAVMQNLKTGKVIRSVLNQQHMQQQGDYGASEIEAEMAASMQQQQAKRRAAASKRTSSSKRQKQDSQAAATKGKDEGEDEAGDGEGWSSDDEGLEDKEKAGLEAMVEEGTQGYQTLEQKKEEKAAQRGETDELEYGMLREDDVDASAAAAEHIDLTPKFMPPTETKELLRRLWASEWRLLALIFGPGSDLTQALPGSKRSRRSNVPPSDASTPAPFTSLKWSKEAEERIKAGYQMFFVHTLPVVPNKFRPPSKVGEDMFEHPQNVSLQRILTACLDMSSAEQTAARPEDLQNVAQPELVKAMEMGRKINTWLQLQDAVAALMDSTLSERASAEKQSGIRQVLEKKEGLFRKNMMGKRVNYAARSVISPDPYIGAGEIGVPPYFAKRLCFPEKVTPWNVERLRQAVLRGANELNGAVAVEDERGRVVQLERLDRQKREGIAKALLSSTASGGKQMLRNAAGAASAASASKSSIFQAPNKTVFRHLQDGDIMLTNRQPTLHKPGLMAHRARVLKGEKTIRMHYANCSTFNADFDGDEINLHMPQDHYGRAEGALIVHADQQFIVPTDGKPLRGLIQDHVVSGVLLTKRDTWLTKAQYSQLVYIACNAWKSGTLRDGPEDMQLEPPAILKPRVLWSGKQVVSTAVSYYTRGLPPLTFSGGGKVPADYWGGKKSGEAELVFHKGYLVSGCLDKASFGKFGLVHAMQVRNSAKIAATVWLQ
ncbi:hypothetical protein DUNSADRAFT_16129 [Dunaliella salina]|uniref:DNA-directed RNA polymerase subunit n=1 Tax=Dunaliella salina TaxID=3046 RepID=A0ABQ7H181_DUNSA|nr:hypothetical protein DUNSADRAFT_16129 [Dunaliella salina]|eukprot:KAF5840614.1 hypothetical protein DUNSADRAFT_16129 [Dunaliella salina]